MQGGSNERTAFSTLQYRRRAGGSLVLAKRFDVARRRHEWFVRHGKTSTSSRADGGNEKKGAADNASSSTDQAVTARWTTVTTRRDGLVAIDHGDGSAGSLELR